MRDIAEAIKFDVWLYPQEFPIVEHVRDEVRVYSRFINEKSEFIGIVCLKFSYVWYISAKRFMKYKSYVNTKEHTYKSYYLHIDNSSLLDKLYMERDKIDPKWREYDYKEYKHYIVEAHDFYYNIIATDVKASIVKNKKDIKRLYKRWEEV